MDVNVYTCKICNKSGDPLKSEVEKENGKDFLRDKIEVMI